ncbi:MauE/DoxX family redox-associated membrane protein [Nonomuraea insulae]|uniref:MauE/DoxX family redox-associated membrane protein n=1 Tax=Nonomuraea insulae TaxID=1616787 RepID=A0ABW1CD26_9ACTN
MGLADSAELGCSAFSGAVLIHGAAGKLVRPDIAAEAFRELRVPGASSTLMRVFAGFELAAVTALALPFPVSPGWAAIGLLGLAFLGLGALGTVRGSLRPCGCAGTRDARPLGPSNVLMGASLALMAAFCLAAEGGPPGLAAAAAISIGVTVRLLVAHRGDARRSFDNLLTRPVR